MQRFESSTLRHYKNNLLKNIGYFFNFYDTAKLQKVIQQRSIFLKSIWKSYYPRLFRRNHNFYIRIAIPRELWYISKRKEIKYSLKTSNYADALFKMRCKTASLNSTLILNFLRVYVILLLNNT